MKTGIKFRFGDQDVSAQPFHYKMCGLDDVYLLNGFKIHETAHGTGVAVEKADELHLAIGLHLISHRKVLSQKDFKFLRKNMRMTQEGIAEALGVTSQTVARYEKGQTEIPGPVDRLMRVVFALHLIPEAERTRVLQEVLDAMRELEEMDETMDEPVYFGATADGWDKARPAATVAMLSAAASMGCIS